MFRWHKETCAAVLLFVVLQARGQGVPVHLEYRKQVEAAESAGPLNKGAFGDNVSLYDGQTYFQTTDITIPGNNGLAVQLSRRLSIELQVASAFPYDDRLLGAGNWNVDVPYFSATYPQQDSWGCSQGVVPSLENFGFYQSQYWHGITVHIPGEEDRSLLGASATSIAKPSSNASYRWSTNKRDAVDCIPIQNGFVGDGFRMTTASGDRYFFDVATVRTDSTLERTEILGLPPNTYEKRFYLHRTKYYLLASKVQDRFGNTVQFQYNSAGHPTRIWSNDGREILLAYSNGNLASASAQGRAWQYQYDTSGKLTVVVLPDASKWQYGYSDDLLAYLPPDYENLESPECRGTQAMADENYTLTAKHPSGAVGTFEFSNKRHYRSGVHATECDKVLGTAANNYQPTYKLLTAYYFDVMSLTRKTINGPGVSQPMVWSFDYGTSYATLWGTRTQPPVYPCTTCTQTKDIVVTNPDATKVKYRYGMEYRYNDGRLFQVDTLRSDGVVIKSEVNEYLSDAAAQQQPFYGQYGNVLGVSADPVSPNIRPVIRHDISQDSVTFHNGVNSFDSFARPVSVTQSSSLGYSKIDATEYYDDTTRWVLSQVKRHYNVESGLVDVRNEYDPNTALVLQTFAFEKLKATMTWNANGTLATSKDGNNNTAAYGNWKRGIPQNIQYANGTSVSAIVNDNGWI